MSIYESFEAKVRRISKLNSIAALLRWDQETHLPKLGAPDRASQLSLLASLAHSEFVSPEMEDFIGSLTQQEAAGTLTPDQLVNVREVRRSFERARKLPASLVERISTVQAEGYQAWEEAREAQSFSKFGPLLHKHVELQREVASLYGYTEHPYDALLDLYEPGATSQQLTAMFEGLKAHIVPLADAIASRDVSAPPALAGSAAIGSQIEFARDLAQTMGFDFSSGRLDESQHPFTTSFSPGDVRLTVHYYPGDPFRGIFTILHEGGHGLYRQGLDREQHGLPIGDIVSSGVDESQARFWENVIGRSRAFWTYALPRFQAAFPGTADHLNVTDVCSLINRVQRSLIRVGADEVTYNLHILIRFEIERDIMGGKLDVKDLPEVWNSKVQSYLGLQPASLTEGVLQDPHWSDSYFGYFPTYTLGNLYAAQFGRALRRDLPDLDTLIAQGDFQPVLSWLREKIHRHGKRLTPSALIEKATGTPPSSDAFVEYVLAKYISG